MYKIPVIKPYFTVDEEKEILKSLRSGWLVQGPQVEEFEKKIAGYLKVKYAVATNSCTASLHLALIMLGIGHGDEVIVPSFTFVATPNSVMYTGATPIFADIDPKTYNIDPKDIEKKITKKTKGILPVHQIGLAAPMREIMKIAKKHSLFVVEDGACAFGATIRGKHIGTFGDMGCFSFHPRKSITTAEGGMLVTNKSTYADTAQRLRSHGMSVSDRERHLSKTFINESYSDLGYNYRMSDIHASIGIAQFKKINMVLTKRRKLAARYTKYFLQNPYLITPFEPDGYFHTYQSYVIQLAENVPVSREKIMNSLLQKGISTRIGVKASHLEPLYTKSQKPPRLPHTEKAAQNIITLPLYVQMTKEEQDYVIANLFNILKSK